MFLEDLPTVTEGRLRYSNSELTEIVDFKAVFFVLGDTRIILSGIIFLLRLKHWFSLVPLNG